MSKKPVKVRVTLRLRNSGHVRSVPVVFEGGHREVEVTNGAVIEIDVDTWLNARVVTSG